MRLEQAFEPEDAWQEAREELKRADHLLFVSLKYTRTVDVIKSVIHRLINACDYMIIALLRDVKRKKKIAEVPMLPRLRAELARSYCRDPLVSDYIDFYIQLRKINIAAFSRSMEYRRHVTMTVEIEGAKLAVTIDKVQEYFEKTKAFIEYLVSKRE